MGTLKSELVNFIKEETLESSLKITEDLSIENDLGISGDDAYEFIMTFSEKFQVDISDFDYDEYFDSEPSWLGKISKKKALTVGMLNKALEEGKFRIFKANI